MINCWNFRFVLLFATAPFLSLLPKRSWFILHLPLLTTTALICFLCLQYHPARAGIFIAGQFFLKSYPSYKTQQQQKLPMAILSWNNPTCENVYYIWFAFVLFSEKEKCYGKMCKEEEKKNDTQKRKKGKWIKKKIHLEKSKNKR